MHNIYIDNNGNLFDGNTCDVSRMTLCELNSEGGIYSKYNLDGTPDLVAIEALELANTKAVELSEALAYLTSTDYKVLPDYDGDTTGVVEARAKARITIRTLGETV